MLYCLSTVASSVEKVATVSLLNKRAILTKDKVMSIQ